MKIFCKSRKTMEKGYRIFVVVSVYLNDAKITKIHQKSCTMRNSSVKMEKFDQRQSIIWTTHNTRYECRLSFTNYAKLKEKQKHTA